MQLELHDILQVCMSFFFWRGCVLLRILVLGGGSSGNLVDTPSAIALMG